MESQEIVTLPGPQRAPVEKSPTVKSFWIGWLLLALEASVVGPCAGPEGSRAASRLHRQRDPGAWLAAPSPEVFLEFDHSGETLIRSKRSIS